MTNTDKVQELTESLPVMPIAEAVESPQEAVSIIKEEENAVDEMNIKSAQDLSQVITALQGTVISSEEHTDTTIPEETELDSSLINGDSPIKADIDLEDISAQSEPDSPRPKPSDLSIATHFEKTRSSIDVPEGQNMADFVTLPSPGLASPSLLVSDDENDDDLPKTSNEKAVVDPPTVAAAAAIKPPSDAITLFNIDFENVRPNFLSPRAQEKYGNREMSEWVCLY